MRRRDYFAISGISLVICFVLFTFMAGFVIAGDLVLPTVVDPGYRIQALMPKTPANGFTGLAFDNNGQLYAGCVQGSTMYKIDKDTGVVSVFIGPPDGMADDMVFLPDGTLIWNAFFLGKVYSKSPDGKIMTLAEGLPGINAIARSNDGKVYVTQCFMGDAVWELDLTGQKKNRKVVDSPGWLNAFAIHTDGFIYGPLEKKGQIAKIDPKTGKIDVVATGFKVPRAAKFDSKGNFYVLDTATGEVLLVDIKTGQKKLAAMVRPHLDNLAFDKDDRLFVCTNGDSSLFEVDVKTGKVRTVVDGKLACPQGVAVWNSPKGEILYVADNFSYKRIDGFTGEVVENAKGGAFPNAASILGDKVLMTGWFRNVVEVFDAKNDDLLYGVPGFKAALGIMMLPDQSILVAEAGTNSIVRAFDKEGKNVKVVAKDFEQPVYMAPAGDDAIYVTEFLGNKITKVDLRTGIKQQVVSGLNGPKGIAIGTDDFSLIVLNTGTKELLQINPGSGAKKTLVKDIPIGLTVPAGFIPAFTLSGVAVAESGNIYFASDIDNVVYKLVPKN
jgi:DNA-binding beta-propeller fold protein YncE